MYLIIGIVIIGLISVFGFVLFIIKRSLNSKGVYQLYWTTKKGTVSFKYFQGQFRIKANDLELAKQIGIKKLQEKYQDKSWFNDIKFTIRGGGEKSVLSQEKWISLVDVI